jgi:hypothetical protein
VFRVRKWLGRTVRFQVGWEKKYPTDLSVAWDRRNVRGSLTVQLTVRGRVTTILTFDSGVRKDRLAMRKGGF